MLLLRHLKRPSEQSYNQPLCIFCLDYFLIHFIFHQLSYAITTQCSYVYDDDSLTHPRLDLRLPSFYYVHIRTL